MLPTTTLETKIATILIIDDDHSLREWLAEVLGEAGYRIHLASDGRGAVPALRSTPTDLLIIDLIMPGQEGIETIREIRGEFPEVRIIAMSGGHSVYLKVATTLGANASLLKPFTGDEVLLTVRSMIG